MKHFSLCWHYLGGIAIAILCGCSRAITSGPETDIVTIYRSPDENRFQRIVREVVADSVRWQAIWDSLGAARSSGAATTAPQIDYKHYIAVVAIGPGVTAGDSMKVPGVGAGDSVRVIRVAAKAEQWVVEVTTYEQCFPLNVLTMPAHIVRVRRPPARVEFVERVVRGPACIPLDSTQ